jgi:hypothetical protein
MRDNDGKYSAQFDGVLKSGGASIKRNTPWSPNLRAHVERVIQTLNQEVLDHFVVKPNILVIWGDDIGTWNISHNNRGMMGYKTPNIDRIAGKASPSPTTTRSRAAPRAAPPSSAAACPFAPA